MTNMRISYSHIIFSLVLLLAAVLVGVVLATAEPSGAATAYASDGITGVDAGTQAS